MQMMPKNKLFVGTIEAARILHVDPTTIQRWVDTNLIPSFRTVGGHRRIGIRDLQEFASSRKVPISLGHATSRVLIIDDEQDILQMMRDRIRGLRLDLEVFTVSDGFQAGFFVHRYHPALVFLDIRMPGMNGIEVCKLIKDDPESAETFIVGITASRNHSEINALLAAGAENVLLKPIESHVLREILDHCIPAFAIPVELRPIRAFREGSNIK